MVQAEQQVGGYAAHQKQLLDGIQGTVDGSIGVGQLCVIFAFAPVLAHLIVRVDKIENGISDFLIHGGKRHQKVATETARRVGFGQAIEHRASRTARTTGAGTGRSRHQGTRRQVREFWRYGQRCIDDREDVEVESARLVLHAETDPRVFARLVEIRCDEGVIAGVERILALQNWDGLEAVGIIKRAAGFESRGAVAGNEQSGGVDAGLGRITGLDIFTRQLGLFMAE